jgi:hypothetical protein
MVLLTKMPVADLQATLIVDNIVAFRRLHSLEKGG